jgi:cell division protein FtsI/penicillin-binding protein 2
MIMPAMKIGPKFLGFMLALSWAASSTAQDSLAAAMLQAFRGRQGAAVILDVETGRVLASHDMDRAARRLVRPGSAIKPFVLATIAQNGLLREEPGVRCTRDLSIAGRKLNCGHPLSASPLHAEEALAYSCNSYFTRMGARLTPTQLRDGLLGWGVASRSGFHNNEATGSVMLSASLEQLQLQSIGEENLLVTPLGLLNGYRKLALERRVVSEVAQNRQAVIRGLENATYYGMSRLAQPDDATLHGKRLRVAGKTGTSMAAEGPWTHAWFAGFAPAEKPEIVLVVYLENGAGPTDAAPIARELFSAWAREKRR